jgi:excisionase family DNA binding protein
MSELLTTRQLQDLLQVDRVTIYRMLREGRLRGFKVGGQWRFSRQEIEDWLQARRATVGATALPDDVCSSSHVLPLSCVQAIQSVYAEALDIAAVTVDPDGTPVARISNSCPLCDLILSTDEGRRRCGASWLVIEGDALFPPPIRVCHAGLLCASARVKVGGEWVVNVAGCQFVARSSREVDRRWQANLSTLAVDLGLDERELRAAAKGVRSLAQDQLPRASRLLQRVADTFSEIGEERLKLVGRLQRIAEITNV